MTEAEYRDQHPEYDEYESPMCHDCSLCRHKKTDGIMIWCPYDESPRNPDCGFELMKPTLAQAVSEVEDLNIDYGNRTQEEVDYVDACIDTLIEFAKRSIERKKSDGWIPVSERLPAERLNPKTQDFEEVICTTIWGDVRTFKFGKPIGHDTAHFWQGSGIMDEYIVAWKPLSKPYTESEEEE